MKTQVDENNWDCLIVGGGLAGGLLLEALSHFHPNARVLLLEKTSTLGGNHTWCFHSADVMSTNSEWLKRLISKSWPSYEVFFPKFHRTLESGYCAIRSEDFHKRLMDKHHDSIRMNQNIKLLDSNSVTLEDGRVLRASCVVDARGWDNNPRGEFGYQKFLGLDIRLKRPHGLTRVRLKDVRVPQTDGYRFVYLLPWNEFELLIEDTYYSNTPNLDTELVNREIFKYIQDQGWEIDFVIREEQGSLPLALKIDRVMNSSALKLGASSGIYQPVTGYTFPQTLERVQALAEHPHIDGKEWKKILNIYDEKFYIQAGYLSLLNRMLFKASHPDKRYVMLERFYTLPQDLIERFYQGQLSLKDKFRIMWGKPPVSIFRALKALPLHSLKDQKE